MRRLPILLLLLFSCLGLASGVTTQLLGSAEDPEITLSGQAVNDNGAGTRTVGYRVGADGKMYEFTSAGGYVQIDSATDWIIPNASASIAYQVRVTAFTDIGTGTYFDSGTAEDIWIDLSVNRTWLKSTTGTGGSNSVDSTFTFEIRLGTASALASTVYTQFAEEDV